MNAISVERALRIRGPILRRALIVGARRVIADRETLNRINVFPVADGDTGSNLAFTMGSVLNGALSQRTAGVGDLLRRVAEDAIDGGRGNSGAILAQFFTGTAEHVGTRAAISPMELASAVRAGSMSARLAVMEPREGTILSVIGAFAAALEPRADVGNIASWFAAALGQARAALAYTPQQLPVLMKAGVVDAGAQGFVDLLEGINAFLQGGTSSGESLPIDAEDQIDPLHAHGELLGSDAVGHRWCSECLVLGEGLDHAAMRSAVAALDASCVVVAGSRSRMRLHAHVDNPQELFDLLAGFGKLESTKADDMHAQARTAVGCNEVAVITDSSADLPLGVAEALNIHVVPLRLNFGDQDYLDRIGLTPSQFYRKLRQSPLLPRTSQPPPGDFRRQFDFLLSHHPSVIYVGVARALSGTIQAAEAAAQRGDPARTFIFDGANAAGGQALLAMAAAEAARRGDDAASILARLEALRPQTMLWAITRDLTMVVRGGRLPAWSKALVDALGLTPVARMKPDGRLRLTGGMFGRQRLPERFAAYVARRIDRKRRWRVIVGHCDASADAESLLIAVRGLIDCRDAWIVETGPAIGAHAGPGALLICMQPVD